MKKLVLIIVLALSNVLIFAQDKKEATEQGWTKKGNISFLFN